VSIKDKLGELKKLFIGKISCLFMLLRVFLAVVLLIIASSLELSSLICTVIYIAALVAAGFDIAFKAYKSVRSGDYYAYELVVTAAAVLACVCGYFKDAVLLLIFYQMLSFALLISFEYSESRLTRYMISASEPDIITLETILSQENAGTTAFEKSVRKKYPVLIKAVLCIAVLYVIVALVFTELSVQTVVVRGLIVALLAAPSSLLAALPLCAEKGIGFTAAYGVFIKDSAVLDNLSKLSTVIFDKSDVLSAGKPKIKAIYSSTLDTESFIKTAAYIAYKSEQRVAEAICEKYIGTVRQELIDEFDDIPGCGMVAVIHGVTMCLGTKEVFDVRGIEIPLLDIEKGMVLYLAINDQYAGRILFTNKAFPDSEDLISDMKGMGGIKNVLVTEDSREVSESFARELGIEEVFYECSSLHKIEVVKSCCDDINDGSTVMYVSASNLDFHTPADIDAGVGFENDNADIVMHNDKVLGIPVAVFEAQRVGQLQRRIVTLSLLVKAALLILAVCGVCTLWFAVMTELIAALITVILSDRVPDISLKTIMLTK